MESTYLRFLVPALIFAWAVFILIYIVKNDFAVESYTIFQSTFGALALSAILGFKAIYLDAPKEKTFSATIVVLHELSTGRLFSPVRSNVDDLPTDYIISSHALEDISTVPIRTKLQNLNLSSALISTNMGEAMNKAPLILDQLEYTFWDWLAANNVPSWSNEAKMAIGIVSSGGGLQPKAGPDETADLTLNDSLFEASDLFRDDPIEIKLPIGATITSNRSQFVRTIQLDTKNSDSNIRIALAGTGHFDPTINKISAKVANENGITQAMPFCAHNFTFEWKYKIKPFARYSKVAKMEDEWFSLLSNRVRNSFSWEGLRERLISR